MLTRCALPQEAPNAKVEASCARGEHFALREMCASGSIF
jgi:hypothetical protein